MWNFARIMMINANVTDLVIGHHRLPLLSLTHGPPRSSAGLAPAAAGVVTTAPDRYNNLAHIAASTSGEFSFFFNSSVLSLYFRRLVLALPTLWLAMLANNSR